MRMRMMAQEVTEGGKAAAVEEVGGGGGGRLLRWRWGYSSKPKNDPSGDASSLCCTLMMITNNTEVKKCFKN